MAENGQPACTSFVDATGRGTRGSQCPRMKAMLQQMQSMIAEINDVPVNHDVRQFLLQRLAAPSTTDEQVLVTATDDGAELGVYIDPAVLIRLQNNNPFEQLGDHNLADFCTALEGV